MPELPEVEVVRLGLDPAVTGATITSVDVRDARALTRHDGDPADFERRLSGRTVLGTARRGKFLWLRLVAPGVTADAGALAPAQEGTPEAILVHLGMSGQMLLRSTDAPPERHERVRLRLQHPVHGELDVVFVDQRTFGSLAIDRLIPGQPPSGRAGSVSTVIDLIPTQVTHIARDPLDPAFDHRVVRETLRRKSSGIKRVLLDQTLVSGIGNIYADEALWAARIHPETPARDLSTRAVNRLFTEVRAVLERALAEGGTSFDAQYVNVNGESGYFAHSLNAYGQQGRPCPRCGSPIVRVSFMNRSSHLCRRCQRRPRHATVRATPPRSGEDLLPRTAV